MHNPQSQHIDFNSDTMCLSETYMTYVYDIWSKIFQFDKIVYLVNYA